MSSAVPTYHACSRTRATAALYVAVKAILAICFCIGVAGCTEREDTFGTSYDECILKNSRSTQTDNAEGLIVNSCRMHFEVSTNENIPVEAVLHTSSNGRRYLEFKISNDGRDKIITNLKMAVIYYTKNEPEVDLFIYQPFILPGKSETLVGSASAEMPSQNFRVVGTITREIPTGARGAT